MGARSPFDLYLLHVATTAQPQPRQIRELGSDQDEDADPKMIDGAKMFFGNSFRYNCFFNISYQLNEPIDALLPVPV